MNSLLKWKRNEGPMTAHTQIGVYIYWISAISRALVVKLENVCIIATLPIDADEKDAQQAAEDDYIQRVTEFMPADIKSLWMTRIDGGSQWTK